jgi:aminoglycoside phosphotransferase (APT) family kinase protein
MPAEEWAAEVDVDEALVRRVLGGQFPELALDSVRLLGEGWDNSVWVVDERFVFRFPRREIAVSAVERQVAMLPRLAPLVPLRVPEPAFAGVPGDLFRWPFFGAPFLPGREIADVAPGDEARIAAARPLAEFLRALHEPALLELPGAGELPVDPMGRADMGFRVGRARARMAELRDLGVWDPPARVEELLEEAAALPPAPGLAVVHGDLHLRHLLLHDDGSPAAVVDWDDLCRGDPAIDLLLYWCFLPASGRDAFRGAYPVDDEQLLRARVLSLFLCGALAVFGRHQELPALQRESVAGLERTLAG